MSGPLTPDAPRSAVILGTRTLGGAVAGRLLAEGWRVAAVARSAQSLAAAADRGALALRADAADPGELREVLEKARAAHGGPDLIVNAVNATRPEPGDPFGGGTLAEASLTAFRGWGSGVAEQAFVFLSTGIRLLREQGGGTLIQVTGGSSRQARAGAGCWAAGAAGTRALVQAAAAELRDEPVNVALLIIDGAIGGADAGWDAPGELADLADAVRYLARPGRNRVCDELFVTRTGRR